MTIIFQSRNAGIYLFKETLLLINDVFVLILGGSYVDPYQSAWTQQSTWGPQTWDQSSWMMNSGLSQYPTVSTTSGIGFHC